MFTTRLHIPSSPLAFKSLQKFKKRARAKQLTPPVRISSRSRRTVVSSITDAITTPVGHSFVLSSIRTDGKFAFSCAHCRNPLFTQGPWGARVFEGCSRPRKTRNTYIGGRISIRCGERNTLVGFRADFFINQRLVLRLNANSELAVSTKGRKNLPFGGFCPYFSISDDKPDFQGYVTC